jgi:hypothetical protein
MLIETLLVVVIVANALWILGAILH